MTMARVKDAFRVLATMIELEVRRVLHDRTELYLRAVQPLLWLLIFGPVMGSIRGLSSEGVPYSSYIMPGVLIQSTTMVSIFFGLVIIWERESGILKKLIATPAPRYAIAIGRSLAAGVRALFQVFIVVPVALIIGIKIIPNPVYFLTALLLIFLSAGGFAGLSILIASILKTRERFLGIGQVIVFPLFFASNALYPISMMPPALQLFAKVNPMTYIVSAVRGLLITGNVSQLPLDISVILLFDAVIFTIASLVFKKVVE